MCYVLAIVIIGTRLMATGPGPSGWYVNIHFHKFKAATAVKLYELFFFFIGLSHLSGMVGGSSSFKLSLVMQS